MHVCSGRWIAKTLLTSLFFTWCFALGIAFAAQGDESSAPRTSLQEFRKLLNANGIVVLDVRSRQAYLQGHIPGAISIPLDSVAAHAGALKETAKPIVAYCS